MVQRGGGGRVGEMILAEAVTVEVGEIGLELRDRA